MRKDDFTPCGPHPPSLSSPPLLPPLLGHCAAAGLAYEADDHPGDAAGAEVRGRHALAQRRAAQPEASERGEERREAAGEAVGAEVKDAEAVAGGVGPGRRRDGPREGVAVEAELGDAVAEVPYGGGQVPVEAVPGEVERGERRHVAELEWDGAREGVGGEVDGVERGEGAEVRREATGERGGGEADGDEEESGVGGEGQVAGGGGGVAAKGPAIGVGGGRGQRDQPSGLEVGRPHGRGQRQRGGQAEEGEGEKRREKGGGAHRG